MKIKEHQKAQDRKYCYATKVGCEGVKEVSILSQRLSKLSQTAVMLSNATDLGLF